MQTSSVDYICERFYITYGIAVKLLHIVSVIYIKNYITDTGLSSKMCKDVITHLKGIVSSRKVCLFLPTIVILTGVVYIDTKYKTGTYPLPRLLAFNSPKHQRRVDKMKYICSYKELSQPAKNSSTSFDIIYAEDYNLAYIHIPKVGSTFLKQMFYILKHGIRGAGHVFRTTRAAVHGMTNRLMSRRTDLKDVLTLVTVRNPYTRLFSAYIDKVYLPISFALGKEILYDSHLVRMVKHNCTRMNTTTSYKRQISKIRETLACTHNISFEDFVQYVTTEPRRGKPLLDHYAPCSAVMSNSICRLGQTIVIKQETFSDDVKYLLQFINVQEDIYDIIDTHLHAKRAETNIRSVVSTVYKLVKKQYSITSCWTMFEVAKRLWKAFQFQGYINASSDFPKHLFSDNDPEPDYVISVMLNELKENPLSESESKIQRVRAAMKAFENICDRLISEIQEMYALDFDMFDYDLRPSGI